jgi:hypothetical protein
MSVDRAQLQILIRDLGAIPPAVQKTMRPAVLKAGRPVLAQMRANAAWSTRIPGAISMRASGTSPGVEFRVNAGRAPHARPYENGSLRNPGMVRHPVFGNREVWRETPIRPFFFRAVQEKADEVANALGDAVMDAAAQHGF